MTTPVETPPTESAAPREPVMAPPTPADAPPEPSPAARPPRAGFFHRLFTWFWPGEPSDASAPDGTLRAELERRARLAASVASEAYEPRRPYQHGAPDAVCCELYRQAIYWSLGAHALRGTAIGAGETEPARLSFARLWRTADPALLERAAGSKSQVEELFRFIVPRTYADFAELEPSEQARLARLLHVFTTDLLNLLDERRARAERAWIHRVVRIGMLTVSIALAAFLVTRAVDALRWRHDLAEGRPWRASSRYPEHGCVSPDQRCPGPYFFSTNEEDAPWLEIDLQREESIARLELQNRTDCCPERAAPITVEVSSDSKQWRRVARQDAAFSVWRTSFAPVRARWVKIRAEKRTNLHLRRVRIGR